MDPLFKELPEDLATLSDEDLQALLAEHEAAARLIDEENPEFLAGLEADDVLAQLTAGVEQIEAIRAEQARRVEAEAAYETAKAELKARLNVTTEEEPEAAEMSAEEPTEEEETEEPQEEEVAEETAEEPQPVIASAETNGTSANTGSNSTVTLKQVAPLRRPPAP